jgi:radical SAM protein with 4Fe4S-binding SPASM domain
MEWAVGVGTTNACNYNCKHCYSRGTDPYYLNVNDIKSLVESLEINSLNLGTGENGLNPHLPGILDYISERKIKSSLTSNGYTIAMLSEMQLNRFNDIDISIDFPKQDENDDIRGAGAFSSANKAIEKCKACGVETSIVCCLTNKNYNYMEGMVELSNKWGVNLRVNVYKPVHNEGLKLNYEQFWSAMKTLLGNANLVSCSEPIVNTILGIKVLDGGCPCGKMSVRVRPDGVIVPCVYWPNGDVTVQDVKKKGMAALLESKEFQKIRMIPQTCRDCEYVDICKGGCASRRIYNNLNEPDEFCYIYNKKEKPELKYKLVKQKDLVHCNYLCTLILAT